MPSRRFPTHVKFDYRFRQYEIVQVGFCQLSLMCFKDIYGLLKNEMSLPELSKEPEIIVYDDQSYALSWWPHQIYRQQFDELFNHEVYSLSEEGEYYH